MGSIDWIPIADLPDYLKDGREVLLWDGDSADVGTWSNTADFGHGEPGWSETTEGGRLLGITHFAELNVPD